MPTCISMLCLKIWGAAWVCLQRSSGVQQQCQQVDSHWTREQSQHCRPHDGLLHSVMLSGLTQSQHSCSLSVHCRGSRHFVPAEPKVSSR